MSFIASGKRCRKAKKSFRNRRASRYKFVRVVKVTGGEVAIYQKMWTFFHVGYNLLPNSRQP